MKRVPKLPKLLNVARYRGAAMARARRLGAAGVVVVTAIGMTACAAKWDPPRGTLDAPPGHGMARMQVLPHMDVDPQLLEARADEMQRVAQEVREHVLAMRALSPEELHPRLMEHTAYVARVQSLVTRHTTDMYHRFQLDEEAVSAHFGMRPDQHRELMGQLSRVREEAGRLQVAQRREIERRMPSHLDRVEAVTARVEEGAARMAAARR